MDERPPNVIPFPSRARAHTAPARDGDFLRARRERAATMLVAELRGWRTMTESLGWVRAQAVLAGTMDLTIADLLGFNADEVTLDGEPMQPVLSARFEGSDHPLRALRAAYAMRAAAADAQSPAPPGRQFQLCTGINTGEIVELALGDDDPVVLQSVGTLRSFAVRLEEFAGPGQILIAGDTYATIRELVAVRSIGQVRVGSHGERQEAFAVTGLVPAPGVGDPAT